MLIVSSGHEAPQEYKKNIKYKKLPQTVRNKEQLVENSIAVLLDEVKILKTLITTYINKCNQVSEQMKCHIKLLLVEKSIIYIRVSVMR